MNILIPDAYFWPEKIAFTHLEEDLLDLFIKDGNSVTVLCPIPTRGTDKSTVIEFRNRLQDSINGVNVIRFWAPQEGRNPLVRALRYFWCNYKQIQIGKRLIDTDIIFAVSTPPTQGLMASKLKRKLSKKKQIHVPLVYSLQDVFPDSLVNAGLAKENSIAWKLGRMIEDKTYQNSDAIVVISEGMKKNIQKKGVEEEKISLIPNWIDFEATKSIDRIDNRLMDELNIPKGKKIVLYAGNFGETQGAEIIIDVARKLSDEKDILFVLFGGGPGYKSVKKSAEKLDNIMTFDLQPIERVSEVYSMGDVVLVTCKPGTGKASMPSKLWSIMACNRRIIAAFDLDSDLSRLVNKLEAGRCVEPGNSDAIAESILLELSDESKKEVAVRNKAMAIASKEACTVGYLEVLKSAFHKSNSEGKE